MQARSRVSLADEASVDASRLLGCNGHANVLDAERQIVVPPICRIPNRKRIALVAHDNRKEELALWARKHRTRLIEHDLYATGHTADMVAAALNTPVFRFLSGPLGGDQQIGSRIAESKIDVLVFFWDPLVIQPHDCDVKALLRLATAYNIPSACNEATADCVISALHLDALPQEQLRVGSGA
jgi:methylglyoxal synthase